MNDRKPLVVANLKANKTWEEVSSWLDQVAPASSSFAGTIIFCPPLPFLIPANQKIKSANWRIKLASQDVSRFEQGAYTGEVAASQIVEIVAYAIIGHSERRQNFNETEEVLAQKVENSQKAGIEPIFCIQGPQNQIPQAVNIVAYEPPAAIGTGKADSPQNAQGVSQKLKAKGNYTVLYGGSVSGQNVQAFLEKDVIDGVLVGATNSLDPAKFIEVIQSASF